MMKIFNTPFEVSMRILLLLDQYEIPLDSEKILYLDYFTILGKDYGFSESNINGDGLFLINDLTVQYSLINSSIKSLVLQNLITVQNTADGFLYVISKLGKDLCENMTSDYSYIYKEYAKNTYSKTKDWDIRRIKEYAKKREEIQNAIHKN